MNTELNPATKLPHTPAHLARVRPEFAALLAALEHCKARSRTRKRSVEKLMAEKGYRRVATSGPVDAQWVTA